MERKAHQFAPSQQSKQNLTGKYLSLTVLQIREVDLTLQSAFFLQGLSYTQVSGGSEQMLVQRTKTLHHYQKRQHLTATGRSSLTRATVHKLGCYNNYL